MGAFKRFEDIVAWQKARLANQLVYRLTRERGFVSDFALRDQIRRASLSVMAKILRKAMVAGLTENSLRFLALHTGP